MKKSLSLDEAVGRLARLATELNDRTEQVNTIIDGVNERLASMNLGVTVWLQDGPWPLLLDPSGQGGTGVEFGSQLGFTKVEDRWQLAVRTVTARQKFYQNDESMPYMDIDVHGEPLPLRKATRLERVGSCRHLNKIVNALSVRAKELLDGIAVATAAAKLEDES